MPVAETRLGTATKVRDVCGAGDTVFAALAVAMIMGQSLRAACRTAMGAAGRQVAKVGIGAVGVGERTDRADFPDRSCGRGGWNNWGSYPDYLTSRHCGTESDDSIRGVADNRTPVPRKSNVICHHLNYFVSEAGLKAVTEVEW